jgi:hypothetical protein
MTQAGLRGPSLFSKDLSGLASLDSWMLFTLEKLTRHSCGR